MRTNWKHKRIFEFACISATETIPTWKKIWSVNLIQLLLNNKVKSNEFFSEKIDLIFIHIKLWTTLYFQQRWNLKWKLILTSTLKKKILWAHLSGNVWIKGAIRMNFIKFYLNKNVIEKEHSLFEFYFLWWNIFDFLSCFLLSSFRSSKGDSMKWPIFCIFVNAKLILCIRVKQTMFSFFLRINGNMLVI